VLPLVPLTLPHLPATRAEMDARKWDSVDVVLVSGDAYVDHPAFAMGILGRVLEAAGFRVAILSQPDWRAPSRGGSSAGRACSSASAPGTWTA
jgi:hypothetical protein